MFPEQGRSALGGFIRSPLGVRLPYKDILWEGPDETDFVFTITSMRREKLDGTLIANITPTNYLMTTGGIQRLMSLGLNTTGLTNTFENQGMAAGAAIATSDTVSSHPGWTAKSGFSNPAFGDTGITELSVTANGLELEHSQSLGIAAEVSGYAYINANVSLGDRILYEVTFAELPVVEEAGSPIVTRVITVFEIGFENP